LASWRREGGGEIDCIRQRGRRSSPGNRYKSRSARPRLDRLATAGAPLTLQFFPVESRPSVHRPPASGGPSHSAPLFESLSGIKANCLLMCSRGGGGGGGGGGLSRWGATRRPKAQGEGKIVDLCLTRGPTETSNRYNAPALSAPPPNGRPPRSVWVRAATFKGSSLFCDRRPTAHPVSLQVPSICPTRRSDLKAENLIPRGGWGVD